MLTIDQEARIESQKVDLEYVANRSIDTLDQRRSTLVELAAKYKGLTIAGIEDTKGFEAVHEARMVLKRERVKLEKDGKALRDPAVKFSQRVIERVNDLTLIIFPTEEALEKEEQRIEQLKAEAKVAREREEAKQLQERLNALNAYNFAGDYLEVKHMSEDQFNEMLAHAKDLFDQDQARIAQLKAQEEARRKEEEEKLRLEREEFARQQEEFRKREADLKAQQEARELELKRLEQEAIERRKKEEEALEAERQKIAAEKRAIEEEKERERQRIQAIKDEEDRKQREEQERIEREQKEKQRLERIEALRPDKEKLFDYTYEMHQYFLQHTPDVKQAEANIALKSFLNRFQQLVNDFSHELNSL